MVCTFIFDGMTVKTEDYQHEPYHIKAAYSYCLTLPQVLHTASLCFLQRDTNTWPFFIQDVHFLH